MTFFLLKRFLAKDKKHRRSSVFLLSAFGIFLTTTIVLVTLGILSGYQRMYTSAVLSFSTQIVIFSNAEFSQERRGEIENFLTTSPYANHFSPYHFYETLGLSEQGAKPLIFKGVDFDKLKSVYPVVVDIKFPEIARGVLVGTDILRWQPKVFVTQSLSYLKVGSDTSQYKTQVKTIPVTGSFSTGYFDFDSQFVLMPLSLLQETFSLASEISGYEIRLQNDGDIDALYAELQNKFSPAFEILTWKELNTNLFEALKLDRTVIFSICFLVLLISCLNVFGFNFLFFVCREREFKILSLLGMSATAVRALFVSLSFMIGGVSVTLASLASVVVLLFLSRGRGLPLDPEVYFVDRVPVYFESVWFIVFIIGTLLLCVLTSFLAGKIILKKQNLTLLESLQ